MEEIKDLAKGWEVFILLEVVQNEKGYELRGRHNGSVVKEAEFGELTAQVREPSSAQQLSLLPVSCFIGPVLFHSSPSEGLALPVGLGTQCGEYHTGDG